MAMSAEDLADLKKLLQKARQKPIAYGLCLGKKPEDNVLYLDLKKSGEVMSRKAKKDGETGKITYGEASVKGKILTLMVEGKMLPGLAKNMKLFMTKQDMKMKVVIVDPSGNELESDGDEDGEEETPDTAATAPAEETPETAAAAPVDDAPETAEKPPAEDGMMGQWARVATALDPFVTRFAASGHKKSAAVSAAWAGAAQAADKGDYKTALTVAAKIKPLVTASAGGESQETSAPDPMAQKWTAAFGPLEKLFAQAMANNPDNRTKLEAAWNMAVDKAGAGDFKTALTIAAKLKPVLDKAAQAAPPAEDPDARKWASVAGAMEQLYLRAMGNNPENRSNLEAAWGIAQEKAIAKDFAGALDVATRLKPKLEEAAAAKNEEVPKDVVAFQRSRVLWADTRQKMKTEMKTLEDKIVEVCGDDPALAPAVAEVGNLTKRLDVFDKRLEDILDQITNTPEGDARTKLKQSAAAAIKDYQAALQDDFFKEVDQGNGFVNVAVAATATQSLQSIAQTLGA